jgi:hypothetical protein
MRIHATSRLVTFALLALLALGGSSLAAPIPRGGAGGERPSAAPAREKTLPAPVAPAIPDALSRALARGQISEGRYVLERAVSLFDPALVRSRFGYVSRPDPRSATLVLRDLALRLDRLSAGELKDARRILARPTDGDVPLGHAYTVGEESPFCAAHTCVHYVASTDDAPPPDDVTGGPEPDYVATVSAVVEEVWTAEVGTLGYRAPKSDATSDEDGGNGLLDVYLVDVGADGLFGYCASDDPNLDPSYPYWDMSGYCVLDNDYAFSQFGYPDPTLPLKVTAAHELFHAVQFAYDFGEDGWLMEGTATWMEERVYDAINDNRRYLVSSPLTHPLVPLDRSTGFVVYGTWIFWQFLTEYLGAAVPDATIVRAVWKRADGSPVGQDMFSTQALASAVGARTVGGTRWRFRWAFADFAVWNARPGKYYDEGAAYPTAAVARTTTLTGAAPVRTATAKLDHLANRSVVVRRGPGLKATARLRIAVDGPNHGTGPEASVIVIRKSGVSTYKVVDLSSAGNGKVTVVFGTTVARVVVIMTNASTRYRNCYSAITPFACFGGVPVDQNRSYTFRAAVV